MRRKARDVDGGRCWFRRRRHSQTRRRARAGTERATPAASARRRPPPPPLAAQPPMQSRPLSRCPGPTPPKCAGCANDSDLFNEAPLFNGAGIGSASFAVRHNTLANQERIGLAFPGWRLEEAERVGQFDVLQALADVLDWSASSKPGLDPQHSVLQAATALPASASVPVQDLQRWDTAFPASESHPPLSHSTDVTIEQAERSLPYVGACRIFGLPIVTKQYLSLHATHQHVQTG